jgi:hypothetical protein
MGLVYLLQIWSYALFASTACKKVELQKDGPTGNDFKEALMTSLFSQKSLLFVCVSVYSIQCTIDIFLLMSNLINQCKKIKSFLEKNVHSHFLLHPCCTV